MSVITNVNSEHILTSYKVWWARGGTEPDLDIQFIERQDQDKKVIYASIKRLENNEWRPMSVVEPQKIQVDMLSAAEKTQKLLALIQSRQPLQITSLTLRKMLGIWTEAKALAVSLLFGTPYF